MPKIFHVKTFNTSVLNCYEKSDKCDRLHGYHKSNVVFLEKSSCPYCPNCANICGRAKPSLMSSPDTML